MKKENWFIKVCKSIKSFFKEEKPENITSEVDIKQFDKELKFYSRGLLMKKMLRFFIIAALAQVVIILICLIFYWTSL